VPLVENHLAPVYGPHTPRSLRRLSTKVKRLDILANVSRADQAGRPPKSYDDGFYKIEAMQDALLLLDIPVGGIRPLVGGDYLISLGLVPGPNFKHILGVAFDAQIEGIIESEEEAQEFVRNYVQPF
jgi:tRNA nucleotidyltransferase (CCA-adding enzyme)